MIVEDLMQLPDDDLVARPLGAFPKLALWLLRDARDPARLLDGFELWIPSMLEVGRTQPGLDRLKVLITYMFQVIDPMYLDRLRAKIRALGIRSEKVAMTIAEYLHKKVSRKVSRKGASTRCAACSSSSSRPSTQPTRPGCGERRPRSSIAIFSAC